MSGSGSPSRRERKAQIRSLPTALKVVRIAELLYFPVVGFMLMSLPMPSGARPSEMVATAALAAEAIAAVAITVGLGQRRRWAWFLAFVLAGWVITGIVLRGGRVLRAAFETQNVALQLSAALLAWTLITQLVALAGCLTFREWRDELH